MDTHTISSNANFNLLSQILKYLLCLLPGIAYSQVVTTDPALPVTSEPVSIYFHADMGNMGLKDYSGDVYAHTGVITNLSQNPSDWRYVKTDWGENTPETKLVRIEPNLYRLDIGPDIVSYYSVSEEEEILQLAFVFRSGEMSGGSYLEGKTATGGDIFVDVYSPGEQTLVITLPDTRNYMLPTGEAVEVSASSSENAQLKIYIDENLAEEIPDGNSISHTFQPGTAGSWHVIAEAEFQPGNIVVRDTLTVLSPDSPIQLPFPGGSRLGITHTSSTDLRLVVDLYNKEYAYLFSDLTDWRYDSDMALHQDPATGYFWIEITDLEEGTWFNYQFLTQEDLIIADPLSELILDRQLDPELQQYWNEPLPTFPPYASGQVSTTRIGGFQYDWQNDNVPRPNKTDLVIYELLVRDFLEQHDFRTLSDTLLYLQKLGINAIELMPVSEFEGNISWGYNPSFHTAVDKAYGSPEDLKAFIDAAHGLGMAVILDVVYNHVFSQSPLAQLYWDPVLFRPAPDNPWLNVTARHPFNVGFDVDHSSPQSQAWLDACNRHWIEQFHVDGFRFDLSKGFTQTFSGDVGSMNAYDQTRIDLLGRMADTIRAYAPETYIILEHFANNDEEQVLVSKGMMPWGNIHGDYSELVKGVDRNPEWGLATVRDFDSLFLVSFFESHDEQRLAYIAQEEGLSEGNYDVRDLNIAAQRLAAAYAFLLMQPGPKMIWQFGELGFDISINQCPDGTINNECRTYPKPILWDYYLKSVRQQIFNAIRDVNALRQWYPETFRVTDFAYDFENRVKFLSIEGPELSCVIAWNTGLSPMNGTIGFPFSGTWYNYLTGESVMIGASLEKNEILPAGRYRLWTSLDLIPPSVTDPLISATNEIGSGQNAKFNIYPNPATQKIMINGKKLVLAEMYDLSGSLIGQWKLDPSSPEQSLDVSVLKSGLYIVLARTTEGRIAAEKIMVEAAIK